MKKATSWITHNAGDGWGKKLPAIDSGNLGLSAFVPTAQQAKALFSELELPKLDSSKRLVIALTSEDEPHLHLLLQDKKTGSMKALTDANSVDLAVGSGDFTKVLTRVSTGAKWLPLGEGSAPPNWWK